MNQHDRRAVIINQLKPRDRAAALFRILLTEDIADIMRGSDDAALDDLVIAATAIVCHAFANMSDGPQRDWLLAHVLKSLPLSLTMRARTGAG